MSEKEISRAVIRRLPRYFRFLGELRDAGVEKISSHDLSLIMHVTASQIRQDLNNFGGFGQQGYGYGVGELAESLEKIMGLDKTYNIAFVGCGHLGEAISKYIYNNEKNYNIAALCDDREPMQGKVINGMKVMSVEDFKERLAQGGIDIVAITGPVELAKSVIDSIEGSGVRGIWNYAHMDIQLKGVYVLNMHLSDSLHALTYYINHMD